MSLKKILILPVGFILLHTLYIGCCKCEPGGDFFKDVTSIKAYEYGDKNFFSKDSVKVLDSFITSINVNYNYVTHHKTNPLAGFVNVAYAWSCRCDGIINDLGYKYKIDSLVITSNATFKGITSGNNIANFFTCSYSSRTSSNVVNVTIPQLIDSLNAVKYVDGFLLTTTAVNVINKTHKFSYKLYSNN